MTRSITVTVAVAILVGVTLCGGGCKPATPPANDQSGGLPSGGAGGSGTGGSGGGAGGGPAQPGNGLPADLPGGLISFGLFTAEADNTLSHLALATVDQNGQNLTERLALSRDDVVLHLSPDGTKLAAFRIDPLTYTLSFQVYDLTSGAVTQLGLPPYLDIGTYFCWSPDSEFLVYTCLAAQHDYRLVRVPVDGAPGSYVDTVGVASLGILPLASVPGRDAVVLTGPSDNAAAGVINLHDFETDSGRTAATTEPGPHLLAVSQDGRYVAHLSSQGHACAQVTDLTTGKSVPTNDVSQTEPSGMLVDLSWSPVANVLAIVREDINDTHDPTNRLTVAFYDTAQDKITTRTGCVGEWAAAGVYGNMTAWSADGKAFFLAADNRWNLDGAATIFLVDPASGDFTAVFTCADNQSIRGLNVTH